MRNRPRLGEVLLQAGIIDEMQLHAALGEQQRWGRRLGVTLIKMGMVDEEQLLRALARQLDLPIVNLSGKRIGDDVIAMVPAKVASEHGVIPLFVKQEGKGRGTLYLGMEDPSNLAVLDDLSFRTGLEVQPVLVTPSDVGSAIDRYYYARGGSSEAEGGSRGAEAVGLPSLHRLEDRPPIPSASSPHTEATSERGPRAQLEAAEPSAEAVACAETRSPDAASFESVPPTAAAVESDAEAAELELVEEVAADRPAHPLERDVAQALAEVERTRRVAQALTELLVEKGVVRVDEIQARIARHAATERDKDA